MVMSLPAGRKVFDWLGTGRYLEIKHRILPVNFDIGIDCADQRGVFLGSVLDGSHPERQHNVALTGI